MSVYFDCTVENRYSAFSGLLASLSDADVYLHNPRGSNNRLNGAAAARANNNRLFDSQVSFKCKIVYLAKAGQLDNVLLARFYT